MQKILNEIDPKFSPAYNALGMIYDKLENYEVAYQMFSKALNLDNTNSVFYHNRGCCLKNMGKYEESIKDFLKALERDPKNIVTLSNIGLVYRKI